MENNFRELEEFTKDELIETYYQLNSSQYEQRIPTIKEFITSEEYLGSCFEETFYPFWAQKLEEIYPFPYKNKYLEILCQLPIGGGKTVTSTTSLMYEFIKLILLKNPHRHYDIRTMVKITLCLFSQSKTLAGDQAWNFIQHFLQNSPWFRKNVPLPKRFKASDEAITLKKGVGFLLGSSATHALGSASFSALLDEANFQVEKSQRAYKTYRAIYRRMECLIGNTKVPTKVGIKNLKEVEVGDYVYGRKGWNRVEKHIRYKDVETRIIQTARGLCLEGSLEHKMLVKKKYWHDWSWIKIKDFEVGDELYCNDQDLGIEYEYQKLPRYEKTGKSRIDKGFNIEYLTEEFAELLGFYLGDGYIHKTSLNLICGEEDSLDTCDSIVKALLGYSLPRTKVGFNFGGKQFVKFLGSMGLVTTPAWEKEIPKIIMNSPRSVKAAFIRAYAATDGGLRGDTGAVKFESSSLKLLKQLQLLLNIDFGIRSVVRLGYKKGQKSSRAGYVLSITQDRIKYKQIGFSMERKQKEFLSKLDSVVRNTREVIKKIEISRADVYDLTVENEPSYIANCYMSHNSRFLEKGGKIPGVLWLISSPNKASSFLNQKIKDARKNKHKTTKIIDNNPIWQIQAHKDLYCGRNFTVFLGNDFYQPDIDVKEEDYPSEYQHLVIDVPIEYRESFEKDLVGSIADIVGSSSFTVLNLFRQTHKIDECCFLENPFTSPTLVFDFFGDEKMISYVKKPFLEHAPEREAPRVLSIDLGYKKDAFGVSSSYYSSFFKKYKTEWTIQVKSKPGQELPIYKVEDFVVTMKNVYKFNYKLFTSDQFQSVQIRQNVKLKTKIEAMHISVDGKANRQPYLHFKNLILRERWIGPSHPVLKKELSELEDDGEIIDHPPEGSKDTADSACQSLWGLLALETDPKAPIDQQKVKAVLKGIGKSSRKDQLKDDLIKRIMKGN